jgi:hypothetical protein
MAYVHLVKQSVAIRMYFCNFEELGVISPRISKPHYLKGREMVKGWSGIAHSFLLSNTHLTCPTVPSHNYAATLNKVGQ